MKQIVVAAIIHDSEGRIFATQRGYGDFKDYWEFPGGKMEPGETPEEALKREIWEELETRIVVERLVETVEWDYPTFHLTMHCYWFHVGITVLEHLCDVEYDYPEFHLSMQCFRCRIDRGEPKLLEHEAARWLSPKDLESVEWLPADWEVVRKLFLKMISINE